MKHKVCDNKNIVFIGRLPHGEITYLFDEFKKEIGFVVGYVWHQSDSIRYYPCSRNWDESFLESLEFRKIV